MGMKEQVNPMTMKPYPSNIILFNIDDRILTNDIKLALKRSWTHIGEILVRSHEGDESASPRNIIHVKVKYGTRTYLSDTEEHASENWFERMEQHLLSTMRKISSNIIAFNRRQKKYGEDELVFDTLEFDLEAGALTLEYKLDSNGCLPPTCAYIATDIRRQLNEARLGEPARIRIPSKQSYLNQAAAHAEAAAARALETAANEAEQATHEEDELLFVEVPELVEELEQDELTQTQKASPFEVAPLTEEEWEAEYGYADAEFEIDYRVCEALYADGSSREFDTQLKQAVAVGA